MACVSAIGLAGAAVWQRRRLAALLPFGAGKRYAAGQGMGATLPPPPPGDSILDPESVAIVKVREAGKAGLTLARGREESRGGGAFQAASSE